MTTNLLRFDLKRTCYPPNLIFVHFGASTFLAPYLHKLSAVVQILQFCWWYLGQIGIKFGSNLASKFEKLMQTQHFLIVLFRTNLVRRIAPKH